MDERALLNGIAGMQANHSSGIQYQSMLASGLKLGLLLATIGQMNIQDVPFMISDWSKISPTEHPGETGMALWRTVEIGNIRVRMVEYSPGYLADHWCSRGHVLLVLEGELVTELKDGRKFTMKPGMSYQVASDKEPHRSTTTVGAKLFVVD